MLADITQQQTRVGFLRPGFLLLLCCLLFPLWGTEYELQFKTPNLAVYATEQPAKQMQQTLSILDGKIDELQMRLGVYVDNRASVWLVKDEKTYAELALGKAHIVEFSEAFYDGKEQRIYVRSITVKQNNYPEVLLHEYIHWYLENLFTGAPLWFHEGMAMHFSGQMGFDRYLSFLQYSFFGKRSDLFRLSTSYPENQKDWEIFYLSSSMAIRFLSQNHQENWKRFWDLVAYYHRKGEKTEFNNCFLITFNQSLYDFHRTFSAWANRLKWQYLFWGVNAILTLLLPPVVIIGYFRRRRLRLALPDLPEAEEETEQEIPEN